MAGQQLIIQQQGESGPRLLLVEPYLNSSHRCWAEGLMRQVPGRWTLLALSGRHFRWRMRGAASFLAAAAGELLAGPWEGMVCSDMLELAALKGLVPSLSEVPALLYFHENQLDYPAQGRADSRQQERDLYLAFANLASAQAARRVLFNSAHQRRRFLEAGRRLLERLPDMRPPELMDGIVAKSGVLPVALDTRAAEGIAAARRRRRRGPLRLVWNHRWSGDKDPEAFFAALFELAERGFGFEVAVLGQRAGSWPKVFDQAAERLGSRLRHLGPVEDRGEYWRRLFWADVVVSTALQENQGLAVAEGVWAGCRPLVPDALAYPEFYPAEYRYPPGRLTRALEPLLEHPAAVRRGDYRPLVEGLTWRSLGPAWRRELKALTGG